MGTIQLKDFYNAEKSLDGKEFFFISQDDNTRKINLKKVKEFIVGAGTLLTANNTNIIEAINEIQQEILNQTGSSGDFNTKINELKADYVSKTNDLLTNYSIGTTDLNLVPTVQALTDVYTLLNDMIVAINKRLGENSSLGTTKNDTLVNAINEINNKISSVELVVETLESMIGEVYDVEVEGSLLYKINVLNDLVTNNKAIWDNKYTKEEIDNKINKVITDLDWKESVNTYADLSTTYPNAQDGWTVNVKDTDVTYRYSGSAWVSISANAIPLATSSVDGKMSKQDKIDHDDMVSKKHTHSNKSVIDGITSALITAWNNAVSHISDTVKHITSAERTLWNTVSNKADKTHTHNKSQITDMPTKLSQFTNDKGFITSADVDTSQNHTHSNKAVLDGITQNDISNWNNKLQTKEITTVTDFNTLQKTCTYHIKVDNCPNNPTIYWGTLFVSYEGILYQIFMPDESYAVYKRFWHPSRSNWTDWVDLRATDSDGKQINTTYVKKGMTWNQLEGI